MPLCTIVLRKCYVYKSREGPSGYSLLYAALLLMCQASFAVHMCVFIPTSKSDAAQHTRPCRRNRHPSSFIGELVCCRMTSMRVPCANGCTTPRKHCKRSSRRLQRGSSAIRATPIAPSAMISNHCSCWASWFRRRNLPSVGNRWIRAAVIELAVLANTQVLTHLMPTTYFVLITDVHMSGTSP